MNYDFSPLTNYLNSLCKNNNFPGVSLVVSKEHNEVFSYHYGFTNNFDNIALNGDETYHLYSCSKPLTIAGCMRLYERGLLDLDAPVKDYIPEFSQAFLLDGDKKVKPTRDMTIKNLCTMTAGFNYQILGKKPFDELLNTDKVLSALDFAKAAIKSPLVFSPGDKFQYSICLDILGGVAEVITGKRFDQFMQDEVFTPLEMNNTKFLTDVAIRSKCIIDDTFDCVTKKIHRNPNPFLIKNLSYRLPSGGAGIASTKKDYAIFADTMACGGTAKNGYQLLKPETIKLIHAEHLSSFSCDSEFTCPAGKGYGYGLGVRTLVSKDNGQKSPIGEFGWDGACGCYVLMDTTNKLSIFFATNLGNWVEAANCPHAPIRDLTYEILGL